ncbi:hypothetical protein K5X82_12890 [Halosquirtibacter xylanolyticus]|uniref:hypothetical protein n=1 Tax=Halosquirtibacter xylanolyticus TaxID=3374599 RepID=UPI003747EB69|nr:hypothetical protein K5X82_12890 [Prolixibacteraceae bacterium]
MMSCQQDAMETTSQTVDVSAFEILPTISQGEAQTKFAKILSKAVYNDEAVRSFIQREALKQFDCDYDILYGKVKNQEVKDGITFKQALDVYAEDANTLDQIEKSAPLINILLPDLEFAGGLSAEKWDISNNRIGVASEVGSIENTVYGNGEEVYYIGKNEIPKFPLLVVKTNERMVVKIPATKSSEAKYEFAENIYNPNYSNPKSKKWEEWRERTISKGGDTINYLKRSLIYPDIITGYHRNNSVCQRDYAYYKISDCSKIQFRKNRIKEKLYKFRIHGSRCANIIKDEDTTHPTTGKIYIQNNDPNFTKYTTRGYEASNSTINKAIWTDGAWEFELVLKHKYLDGTTSQVGYHFTARGKDLFDVITVSNNRLIPTWFNSSRNEYQMRTKDKNVIQGKWFKPNGDDGAWLFEWDIAKESTNVAWMLIEQDSSDLKVEEDIKMTFTHQKAWNFDASISGKVKEIEFNVSGGYNNSSGSVKEVKTLLSLNDNDDVIAKGTINYNDPLITRKKEIKNNLMPIKTIEDGNVAHLMILPDINN